MKELNTVVTAHINTLCTDGTLEQMIQKQLETTLAETIKDTMRSYGDFGQAIKEKINEALLSSLQEVTLPEYNRFLAEALLHTYENAINQTAIPQMQALLDESFAPVPTTMTADDLLEGMKNAILSWGRMAAR